MRKIKFLAGALVLALAACGTPSDQTVLQLPPTATLQPIPSLTQRVTETLAPTRTLLPTFTFTPTQTEIPPTATQTYTPTLTPTVSGIIQSLQRVNIRTSPSDSADLVTALNPGTGVEVIGQNADGTWFNIRLEDGREGWIFGRLLRVEPTPTAQASATPSPDLTALFLGTPLPTAIIGGGTVTPTPPNQVRTGTPATEVATTSAQALLTPGAIAGVPVIDNNSIFATATALAGGLASPTTAPSVDGTNGRVITLTPGTPVTQAPNAPTATVDLATVDGIDVFAFCDDPTFRLPAPSNIRAGGYVDIWWAWLAKTEEQVRDHIDAASYEIRVNGTLIPNIGNYVTDIRATNGLFAAYWYVPYGPVSSGTYEITYVVTWDRVISDGSANFGPNTTIPFEQETCTFRVP